jgi:hypothetical protein
MNHDHALFLRELLSEELNLYAAMDVPLKELGGAVQQCGEGVVNAEQANCVRWERYREMDGFSLSPDDSFRFGQCVDVVRVERFGSEVLPPYFVLPRNAKPPVVKEVTISTRSESAFDTAGNQANLWLGAYSEFKYRGFMGTLDREFIERSKHRRHEPRDAFLVELQRNQIYGVLELVRMVSDSTWNALLHLPIEPPIELDGIDLFSVHQVGIDEVSAVFRQYLGRARHR